MKPHIQDVLAVLFTVGYFVTLWLYFFFTPPKDNSSVLNLLIGGLTMGMAAIVAKYFRRLKGGGQ